ncbi:hypothetical protein ACTFIZ_001315 [Dictyostelium cf. discoideum]
MYFQISLIIIFSLFCGSNSLVSNYVPVIGRDLITPADIPRAALLTYTNQNDILSFSKSILNESPGDVFNITFSKYYLNNIVALSTSNTFGALSHYNSLISLFNDFNSIALVGLNNTVGYFNTISKYTDLDTTKFDSISMSINNLKSRVDSTKQLAITLASSMNTTKNSLSPSTPNAETVQVVKDNYDLAIRSVLSSVDRLNLIKSPLNDMSSIMSTFKDEVSFYVDFLTTDDEYMANMNTYIKRFLLYSNTLYSRSLLFSRLKELF